MRFQLFLPLILVFVVVIVVAVVVFIPTDSTVSVNGAVPGENSLASLPTPNPNGDSQTGVIGSSSGANTTGSSEQNSIPSPGSILNTTGNNESVDGLITSASSDDTINSASSNPDGSQNQENNSNNAAENSIQGLVTDSQKIPLASASVAINNAAPVLTSSDGSFQFTNLVEQTVSLAVTLAGYNPVQKDNVPVGSKNLVIMLVPEGALTGQVVDQFDQPIVSAQISMKADQGIWVKSLTADGEGRFQVNDAPSGTITIQASLAGYQDQGEGTKKVTTPLSEPVLLRLKQPTFSITGHVVQKDTNTGVAGFFLSARYEDGKEGQELKTVQTDGTGLYIFKDLKLGTYIISSMAQQNAHLNLTIPIDQDFKNVRVNERDVNNVDFVAVPGLTVSGTVQTESGQPVSGAEVTVAHLLSTKTVSSSDGSFTLTNVPSFSQGYSTLPHDFTLQLLATHPQYGSGQSDPLPASDQQTLNNIVITMYQSCSLSGSIVDSNGMPVSDAAVQLQDTVQGKVVQTQSDGGGIFQFEKVPSVRQIEGQFRGTHILTVQKEGYEKKQQELTLQPGEAKTIAIKLLGGTIIQGYLSDNNRKPLAGVVVTTYLPDGGKATAVSDDGGIYKLQSLPQGQYDIQFRLDSNPPLSAFLYGVEAGNTSANAVLIHQEWISQGTVFDADTNQPIKQYMISIEGTPSEHPNKHFAFTKSINSPDGKFQLVYNEPGLYSYHFTAPNYQPFNGSVRIDRTTIHSQILNAWLKPVETLGGISGQFQSQEGYVLVGVNVLGTGSYPTNGNSFQIERLPTGFHDLLFFVRDPDSGLIKPLGVIAKIPVQANQIFNVGIITPQKLNIQYRQP